MSVKRKERRRDKCGFRRGPAVNCAEIISACKSWAKTNGVNMSTSKQVLEYPGPSPRPKPGVYRPL